MQDRVMPVRKGSWKGFLSLMVAPCASAFPRHASSTLYNVPPGQSCFRHWVQMLS